MISWLEEKVRGLWEVLARSKFGGRLRDVSYRDINRTSPSSFPFLHDKFFGPSEPSRGVELVGESRI